MIPLDWILGKIERPTRSGIEGSLVMVSLLFTLLGGLGGAGGGDPWCAMLPWRCPLQAAANNTTGSRWRDLHIQIIAPGRGKGRVCMVEADADYMMAGHRYRWRAISPAIFLEDCSDPPLPKKQLPLRLTHISGAREDELIGTETFAFYWSDALAEKECAAVDDAGWKCRD